MSFLGYIYIFARELLWTSGSSFLFWVPVVIVLTFLLVLWRTNRFAPVGKHGFWIVFGAVTAVVVFERWGTYSLRANDLRLIRDTAAIRNAGTRSNLRGLSLGFERSTENEIEMNFYYRDDGLAALLRTEITSVNVLFGKKGNIVAVTPVSAGDSGSD